MTTNNKSLLAVLILVLVIGGGYLILHKSNTPVACTLEAKICPDGSSVGRVGPSCDFAACPPTTTTDASLKTTTDSATGITFSYPETIPTKYISTVDWPPKVNLVKEAYSCLAAGNETAPAGKTEEMSINGHPYCVTTESEGAAGSVYSNYAYAFPSGNNTVIFTFSLRFVQCDNYDEPNKTSCETERTGFSMNNIMDAMAQSVKFQ